MRKALWACALILVSGGCNKSEPPKPCVPVLSGWTTAQTGKPAYVIANTITLSGRVIRWNGVRIDEQTLVSYLRQARGMNPVPFLVLDPGASPDCSFATHLRDVLEREFPCRDGLCWQGSEAAFKRAPYKNYTGNAVP
jgi:hypothetical protein